MSPAERWLRERLAGAPPALLDAMVAALPPGGGDSVPEALASASVALYETVLGGTGGREDALPLLAADALMTHALEACAELDPDGIAAFARRWGGAGRLGALAGRL